MAEEVIPSSEYSQKIDKHTYFQSNDQQKGNLKIKFENALFFFKIHVFICFSKSTDLFSINTDRKK